MLEMLVLYTCINSYTDACQASTKAYYNTHPEITYIAEYNETRVKNVAGPVVVQYAFPVMAFAAKGKANIKLSKHNTLYIDIKNNYAITYAMDY